MHSGEVSDADRQAFRRWHEQDPAHRAAYAEAEALWNELGDVADPRCRSLSNAGSQASPDASAGSRHGPVRPGWQAMAVVASLLLTIVLGLGPLGGFDNPRADHVTAVGEVRAITLDDGSTVHLNTDTALAVHFSEGRRKIELYRGEAFFTVMPDAARPFEVKAGRRVTRAVGTAFNVHIQKTAVDVSVTEGRVRVLASAGDQGESGGLLLNPGEAVRYVSDGNISPYRVQATAHPASWRQGRLVFVDQPLQRVIAELDRYQTGRILLLDASIANARFSGTLKLSDTESALTAIENSLPVNVIQLTPYLTLLQPDQ